VAGCGVGAVASRWTAACRLPSSSWTSSAADSSLSARHLQRCLEAEEWLRQVCHGGCPCVSSLSTHALSMCVYVRACVFACVRVRACTCTRYDRCNWRFSAPSLIGLRIGLRRDCRHWWGRYAATCACPRGGAGTCVLRAMDFVCGAFVCDVVCASPTPRRPRASRQFQGTCHRPTTGAAGEPARRRRRAPREPSLLRALKTLRAPPSWAHFSVAFSQAGDLGFPIFTEPTTMDNKWLNPS